MTAPTPAAPGKRSRSRRVGTWAIVLAGVALVVFVGASFLPRWWAHKVGHQANESFTGGITYGLFYGFVFTVLPLALIVFGIRRRRSVKAWLAILGGALLLALPNLLTLSIVLGPNEAARAGDRTLDTKAPGFRGASLAGALLAVAAAGFVWYLVASRRRARAELRKHEEQAKQVSGQAADLPVGDRDGQHADSHKSDRS